MLAETLAAVDGFLIVHNCWYRRESDGKVAEEVVDVDET